MSEKITLPPIPKWFERCLREKHPRRNTIHQINNPLITFWCADCQLVEYVDTRRADDRSERRTAPGYDANGNFAGDLATRLGKRAS